MHIYLETAKTSVLIFPAVFLVLMIPLFLLHKRWFGELHEYRAGVFAIFAFYATAAALMTVLPLPSDTAAFCAQREGTSGVQLTPFASFVDIAAYAHKRQMGFSPAELLRNMAFWQILLNIALLAPLGFFLRALYGLRLLPTTAMTFLTSLFLELTQLTGIWSLADCAYRLFDVDDLLTNTLGGVLGWFALKLFFVFPDPKAAESEMWYKKRKK